eukprot:314225-Rhodomonas_salina.1
MPCPGPGLTSGVAAGQQRGGRDGVDEGLQHQVHPRSVPPAFPPPAAMMMVNDDARGWLALAGDDLDDAAKKAVAAVAATKK